LTEWFSGDVIANGIRIHYYRTGGNKPPVVLSHGATDAGLCWVRAAKALEDDYDVIMPDARGHGLSEAPDSGYDSAHRAADLAGFIQALKLEKPAIGGHSMGADTSFYVAADYPALVRCAILEDPPFWIDRGPSSAAGAADGMARMRQQAAERKAMTREEIIANGKKENPIWADEEFGPWADSKQRVSLNLFGGPLISSDQQPWEDGFNRITCPTLLISGDPAKGAIITPAVEQIALRALPSLKVMNLPGAGHNIRREEFEGFMDAVRAFLA
jgi:N-formylmaleamate deformylase